MLAKGLCFTCGEAGHLPRNCPKNNSGPSKKKGKPPGMSTHAVRLQLGSTSRDALHESTTVLETMHVGAIHFDFDGVEEGGEPIKTLPSDSESLNKSFELVSELESVESIDSEPTNPSPKKRQPTCDKPGYWCLEGGDLEPIGDIYAFHATLMLQSAQPYPGDASPCNPEEGFNEQQFLLYSVFDTEYVIMDQERTSDITISKECLRNPDFMPALWYAQTLAEELGLDPHHCVQEGQYLEEQGDVELNVVKIKMESNFRKTCDLEYYQDSDVYEVWTNGTDEDLKISYMLEAMVISLPRVLLQDPDFDLDWWFCGKVSDYAGKSDDFTDVDAVMASIHSSNESDGSDAGSMPALQSVSASSHCESDDGSDSGTPSSMPDLKRAPSSMPSDSSSSGDECPSSDFALFGDPDETLEDCLKMWARASEDCEPRGAVAP
ncbi:hypothetical protein B0H17DRAFT_1196303 [Mycena rosella]|uniref:CCHC-type domain-containing protein n=1 Tax=Mycena rosella TaxID=1033263 RepID=A0AAD7DT88_MYCRO|nr:hypothetical protein B0H17DRAFT_1196303 [Mycena rosella]